MVSSCSFDFFQHGPFSTVSRAEGGGGLLARAATSSRRPKTRGLSAIIRHTKSTSSPRSLHDDSSSAPACATFVCDDVLNSTRLKPFCSSQVVFTPMDPDIAPDFPGGCTGHDPVLTTASPAARKRKPRRLREEGAVGVAIMISDTRGLWHADMIRSAAARPRGAKSATGVLGLVLTKWRLASTDSGRNEALGLHELERRRLQAGTLSGFMETSAWQRQQASSAVLSLPGESPRAGTTSLQTIQKIKQWAAAATKIKKNKSRKSKNPQVGVLPCGSS